MYKIFFHLLGIALLEIIFYFFYIGPFEHNVFVKSFSRSIGGLITRIDSTHDDPDIFLNISSFDNDDSFMNDLKIEAEQSDKDRIEYNYNLYIITMSVWGYCLISVIVITLFYYMVVFFMKRYKGNTQQSIELVRLTQEPLENIDNIEDVEDTNKEQNEIKEIKEIKEKRNLIFKSLEYLFFAGLVLLFEYIFFQYSVLKYHIITDKQIQYLIYKQFDEFVSNYYIINQ